MAFTDVVVATFTFGGFKFTDRKIMCAVKGETLIGYVLSTHVSFIKPYTQTHLYKTD
ncbi:MAG: hypothetical protein M0D57_13920 [Sphingobacteriales bacterium JAD_PAG50586_3]|nr:MAG: hypothetical protein M0D57_13920 [Sphingobacteriales bacterium JAD_PAG50586_3]